MNRAMVKPILHMKIKTLIAFCLLLITASYEIKAQSDTTLKLSLAEAQSFAIDNFFVSKNAELDIEMAQKKIMETTAIGLPQVTATGDFQYIPNPPKISFSLGTDSLGNPIPLEFEIAPETNFTYGATVTQLIFSGEYIVGLQAAKVYRTYSEENYEKTKIDIRESIAGNYYGILILEANRDVLIKTLEALEENLSQVTKTYEEGLIEDTEVDQLQLTVQRTKSDLATLENQIAYMNNLFKYLLGLNIDANIQLTDKLENLIAQNIISDSTYNFILDDNIEYQLLSTNEELQKLALNREKTTYLPTISGFYSYSDQSSATAFSPTINHVLGVSASWSIFQSGMRNAKVAQAKIALEQSQNMKEQESERLRLTAQQAKYDYHTAMRKYQNEKMNFELSEKVLDKTRAKYKLGMTSSLELSIINTQFLGAQISFSTAIQELLSAKVALDKAFNQL